MRSNIFTALVLLAACAKAPSTPPATPEEGTPSTVGGQTDAPSEGTDRPQITAEACEAEGGKVVGDIGDGAIHRPDYRCPDSGEEPIGSIAADPAGPTAIEGAVCCK
jgi:hypothetical protein